MTLRPERDAVIAAHNAALPPPAITTSNVCEKSIEADSYTCSIRPGKAEWFPTVK
jgi:hypothetical protein